MAQKSVADGMIEIVGVSVLMSSILACLGCFLPLSERIYHKEMHCHSLSFPRHTRHPEPRVAPAFFFALNNVE
jgi:hypothetical protein